MKLNVFFILCFTGFTPVARSTLNTVRHKYHLILKKYSWPMAQNYCRVMFTDLATIITADDWIQLKKEATSKSYTWYAWIGLYNDVNSWRWSLNDLRLKSVTYINWSQGQPNNAGGKESCGKIITGGVWGDDACTDLKPFICYNANFSGSDKFILVSTNLTWSQAQNYCRTHHTDLASSLNSSDNDLLTPLADANDGSWFGLYRDTWKWSDGTNATNLPWTPGEPNNHNGNENCATHNNNMFNDYICSQQLYFYCYSMRKQQIMKLQVKSDGSVYDPAVQSFILEQIKKKVEEKGMLENSTVIWKLQSDGNIFHKKNKDDPQTLNQECTFLSFNYTDNP